MRMANKPASAARIRLTALAAWLAVSTLFGACATAVSRMSSMEGDVHAQALHGTVSSIDRVDVPAAWRGGAVAGNDLQQGQAAVTIDAYYAWASSWMTATAARRTLQAWPACTWASGCDCRVAC
jgi:hypothetical protein